jgi:hypothetical protein
VNFPVLNISCKLHRFSQTQIEVDCDNFHSFTVSQTCEVPVIYREFKMVNPSWPFPWLKAIVQDLFSPLQLSHTHCDTHCPVLASSLTVSLHLADAHDQAWATYQHPVVPGLEYVNCPARTVTNSLISLAHVTLTTLFFFSLVLNSNTSCVCSDAA